jgi:hypothetical protein
MNKPRIYKGIVQYALQISLLKIKINLKYSFLRTDVVTIEIDKDDSSIELHWKLTGVSGVNPMLQPWKINLWRVKDSIRREAE